MMRHRNIFLDCIGKPRVVENAVLGEPFGLSRDLGHDMHDVQVC